MKMFSLFLGVTVFTAFFAASVQVDFERTIVFIRVDTDLGEEVFLRGGSRCPEGSCPIPIKHRVVPKDSSGSAFYTWSRGDDFLDWNGPEQSQHAYKGDLPAGTPMMWTTDKHTSGGPTVMEDGFGFSSLNTFGSNFWMVDFDMDCSKTEKGWFELKAYTTAGGTGSWEPDVDQTEVCGGDVDGRRPYQTIQHMARCGMVNIFYYANYGCTIMNITGPLSSAGSVSCGQRSDGTQRILNGHPAAPGTQRIMSGHPAAPGTQRIVNDHPAAPSTQPIVSGHPAAPGTQRIVSGHRAAPGTQRIVNGKPAAPGRWPWMLEVMYKNNHGCGAVLIASKWAITAGHCVRTAKTYGPWATIVRAGETNRHSISGTEKDYFVKNIIKHPLFDKTKPNHDIAILEMLSPIDTGTADVTPACLPVGFSLDQFVGKDCWGIGWGSTAGTGDRMKLQEVKMGVSSNSQCHAYYGQNVTTRDVCAGHGAMSACGGDSGSPLSCNLIGRWYAVGVVSWGDDDCQGRPSVFTRISAYLDWIQSVTGIDLSTNKIIG